MRSVDGSVYWIVSRSQLDYVLHPVFLKFIFIACALYAVLDRGRDFEPVSPWVYLCLWAIVLVVMLAWLGFCGSIIRYLYDRGLIRQVWTPVMLLPMMLVIEVTMQVTRNYLGVAPFKTWQLTLTDVTRDFCVILIFDYLHGQYVVARHPQARLPEHGTEDKGDEPPPAARRQVQASPDKASLPPTPEEGNIAASPGNDPLPEETGLPRPERLAPQRRGSVRIGTETFVLSDILMIRIEDHYLGITTRMGRSLQRAKLAAIEDLHHGDLGIQINRSVWIAFSAIREVQPMKNGQILLVLVNDDEEMVAKPRVYAFRQAYRRARPDAADPFV